MLESKDKLINLLQANVVSNILRNSEDISKCAEVLVTQVRELVGAKVVAVLERSIESQYTLIEVCPQRRTHLFEDDKLRKIIYECNKLQRACIVDDEKGRISDLAKELSLENSIVLPLKDKGETLGLLVILEIMDKKGIQVIIDGLKDLSDLFAILLRNSFLYRDMAAMVDERTKELAVSSEELKMVQTSIDKITDSVFWINKNAEIVYCNESAAKTLGYTREELLRMTVPDFDPDFSPEDWPSHWQELLEKGSFTIATKHKAKQGYLLDVQVTVNRTEFRGVDLNCAVVRDVTEEKKTQHKLRQSQKLDAMGLLAGGIAHDFNNLLAVITGAADLLDLPKACLNDDSKSLVKLILDSTTRAASLTDKLLTFSRKSNLEFKVLDVKHVLKETISMLSRTLDKRISLKFKDTSIDSNVLADHSQLQSVFVNIVINASHAVDGIGDIIIKVTNRDVFIDGEEKKYICVEVEDHGCGMSQDVQQKIFEPFFTTKDQGKGTGLGLSTAYGIVQEHKGFIEFESELGQGTKFAVFLPTVSEQTLKTKFVEPSQTSGLVLLIDDEEQIRHVCSMLLESLGYKVITASNGQEGITKYAENQADISIVVLDMIMPDINGKEVLQEIISINPEAKVVIASGYIKDDSLDDLRSLGMKAYMSKPCTRKSISDTLESVITS
jgi:two-component system, cell cycle sensor histidine kinase and response regulator CckA